MLEVREGWKICVACREVLEEVVLEFKGVLKAAARFLRLLLLLVGVGMEGMSDAGGQATEVGGAVKIAWRY